MITTKEAAKVLGVAQRTMEKYCAAGRIDGAVKRHVPMEHWMVPADFVLKPSGNRIGNPVNLAKYDARMSLMQSQSARSSRGWLNFLAG